jgi:hypothetical protein
VTPTLLLQFQTGGTFGEISATLYCWVSLTGSGIVSPLVLDLFLVDGEARLQVVREGRRVFSFTVTSTYVSI